MMSKKQQKGFTLIEIIMVVIVLGVVATIASLMLSQGVLGTVNASRQDAISWQARVALGRMEREIRSADPNDISVATASQFTFVDAQANTINYQYSGTQLLRNGQVMVDDIGSFGFFYFDKNGTNPGITANIRYVLVVLVASQEGSDSPTFHATLMLRNG